MLKTQVLRGAIGHVNVLLRDPTTGVVEAAVGDADVQLRVRRVGDPTWAAPIQVQAADWTNIGEGYYAYQLSVTYTDAVGRLQLLFTSETYAFDGAYIEVEVVDDLVPSYDSRDAVHLLNQVHDLVVDAAGLPVEGVTIQARPLPTPGTMPVTATNGGPFQAQAGTNATTLVAVASSFAADEHVRKIARITAGTGIGQSREIAATHLVDQVSVVGAFAPAPIALSTFVVELPGEGSMLWDTVESTTGRDGFFILPLRRGSLYDVLIPDLRYRRSLTVPDAGSSRLFAIA